MGRIPYFGREKTVYLIKNERIDEGGGFQKIKKNNQLCRVRYMLYLIIHFAAQKPRGAFSS